MDERDSTAALAAQPKHRGRLTLAATFHEHEAPNSGIALHGKHPRPTPKEISLNTGRFLLRRPQHAAGAPVAGFVTAASRAILAQRARIKRQTIEHRRLQHRKLAA